MPYLTRLLVENCRNVKHLDLDLSPRPEDKQRFRHLILTGPNGSGKTGVLEAIELEIRAAQQGSNTKELLQSLVGLTSLPLAQREEHQRNLNNLRRERPAELFWNPPLRQHNSASDQWVHVFLRAGRALRLDQVEGPKKLELGRLGGQEALASFFLQYLVNLKTEQAFAGVDHDEATVRRIETWFEKFRQQVSFVIDDQGLKVDFDRTAFNFVFTRSDGYRFDLRQLSDGASSVLTILAELTLRADESRKKQNDPAFDPPGLVVIDEIETHLHLKLQEAILPFLTSLFPRIQFIVATHSPAVIASIPGAVVHDLGSHETRPSEEFQGKAYGTLMTGHFGIASDLDLDTTEKLRRYRALAAMPQRSPEQEQEREVLRSELMERSDALAVELWMADGSPPPEDAHDQL